MKVTIGAKHFVALGTTIFSLFLVVRWIVEPATQQQVCPIVQPDSDTFFAKQENLFSTNCVNQGPLNWTLFVKRVLRTHKIWKNVRVEKRDTDGFGDFSADFKRLLPKIFETSRSDVIRIIELGSFKGRSTIEMAKQCKDLASEGDKECQIIAVDTWLASPEHYEAERNDISDLFATFLSNIKHEDLTDVVFPFRLSSTAAAHVFHCYHISADVVFVDSNHEYDTVINELLMYYPLLRSHGLFIGDDFHIRTWPGVVQAVEEFSQKMNRPYEVVRNTWSLFKDDEPESYFWDRQTLSTL
uniref:Class I SAM-dependent methyltransferase n=1 Tax=Steinernema glaseri TaxID=37863 RepID=A0A1I7Z5U5_9BILA